VRDLLLGRRPKDFDVATSAKPNELRRIFRNCRIIGRRFRLAHIFFGRKIIETSTFRANPRPPEEDEGENGNDNGNSQVNGNGSGKADLLIRQDNSFGTAEEDARRRDFTVNGLFYDTVTGQVIDHVNGMVDLEARLVRTIGDPDIRFREDPVRILRAVKFAARCELTIEPETYRSMMEHKGEIAKCAQARVSEEFFRLLRAGAARRSFELLLGTGLLDVLTPELARALRQEPADEAGRGRGARLWGYLAAGDRWSLGRDKTPSDALLLALLLLPPLRDALHPDSTGCADIGSLVTQSAQPVIEQLKASRRDSELARQILLASRYLFPSSNSNRRRPSLEGREFFEDTQSLIEIVTDADSADPSLVGRPVSDGTETPTMVSDETMLPAELQGSRHRGRRRDRRGRHQGAPNQNQGAPNSSMRPSPSSSPGASSEQGFSSRTPIPTLPDLLPSLNLRPAFLGTGAFGSRWGAGID
jgi:poly(A) polymerase